MSASSVKAGEAYVELGLRNRMEAGIKGAQADLDRLGQSVTRIGAVISAGAAGLLAAPIQAASRMEETMGKFNVVFGGAAGEVEAWSKATAHAMQTSEESMASMLGSMQDLLVPMGVIPDRATDMSKQLSTLAIDLGSFNNMQTADVFRDLMAAITGEGQVMKKYGVILTETAMKQELLRMKMDPKTTDDSAKAQARLNIILRGTTAAQGDAIRTSDSFANQMKALWSAVMDASAALGGNLVKDVAALVNVAVSGVYAFKAFVNANQEAARALGLVGVGAVGVGGALIAAGIAIRIASAAMGSFAAASQLAGSIASAAWGGISLVFSVLTIKARIAAAVIRAGWTLAATAIGMAWTALGGVLSVAMQGAIAIVSTVAIVAPWVAGAAVIAIAWFGLDAVMASLAAATAGAWTAAAGTVAVAWTASAGVLIPLSAAIAGAYAASAAFIGSSWLALRTAFATSGAIGVAWALATSAAWAGFGVITALIAVQQAVDAAIISAAWSAASLVASAAWMGFVGVLTIASSPAALLAAAGGLVGASWAIAAGVAGASWAIAWGIISSPILPIIAAIGGVVAVMAGITAAATYAAVAGANFASAWEVVKNTLGQLVSIVNVTFDAIKSALGSGDYATAAQALWLGVQAAFWVGAEASIEAFKWMFTEAFDGTKRFFSSLLSFTGKVMGSVAKAIMHPFAAAEDIGNAISELAGSAMSFDVSGRSKSAQEALKALRDQLAATEAIKAAEKEKSAADVAATETSAQDKKTAETKVAETYSGKVSEIELEILALEQGEQAADRKRLADQGLNEQQIKDIEALKAKREALKELKDAQDAAMQKRADGIFGEADKLGDAGMSPAGIYKEVMGQISRDEEGGLLNKDAAGDARGRAQEDLDSRVENLKQEGKALADSLRTPFEVMKDEIKGFENLRAGGNISDETLQKAIQKSRADFDATQEKANKTDGAMDSAKLNGPTGSFSAFGAGIIGMGQSKDKKELIEIAKNTREANKLARKERMATFN